MTTTANNSANSPTITIPSRLARSGRSRSIASISLLLVAAVLLFSAPTAQADSVKIGEFWLNNVTVSQFKDGRIVFVNASGTERQQPLKEVKGLRSERYTQLQPAEEAFNTRRYDVALKHYKAVRPRIQASEKWLMNWVDYRMYTTYDRLGLGFEATMAFAQLIDAKVDPYFTAKPPLESIKNITDKQKTLLNERLSNMEKRARKGSASHKALTALIDSLKVVKTVDKAPKIDNPPVKPATPADGTGSNLPPRIKSVVFTPREMDKEEDDKVAAMLRKGDFAAAEAEATRLLSAKDIKYASRRLYQLGLAQMYQAEQEKSPQKKQKLYKDAGLSFMRVVIYFPGSTQWVGPALVEAGNVHIQIGRKDKARTLLDQADNFLDPDDEPELIQRRIALAKQAN